MSTGPFDEEAIFRVARKIHPEDARAEYLEQICGNDPIMLDRIRRLLHIHDRRPEFLESPCSPIAATIDLPPIAERPGIQIGPYKLIQEIGEGGMGMVFMALQKEPVRRKVALKIIKPGMDTREVIARFEAEEQALAMMDHPNIARVLDAAATDSGRPYFVMELVNGVPLTDYCDDNSLNTRERLELFVTVCRAVQHAHQKGIIHRDLKPSNILVTLHDGEPVPKIIDFGIAKAVNQELTSKTLATGLGHMIGTPLYMSPEQAERSGLDIDTRSDIYSLGVLLYELLTGSTPFDREQFKDTPLEEIRRVIREEEPPRPSTRISTLGQAATTVSAHRRTDPVQLSNALRHELDWIVMKALEKDRTRRYATANDFARDIERYLHDEPVEACPPSKLYRLKKLMRRNRTAVLATAAVSLALILGAGIATGQAIRATTAEKYAEEQLHIAREQQRLAKQQTRLAQQQKRVAAEAAAREHDLRMEAEAARKQAESVTDFLTAIFRSPDPERNGRTITVAEMLDQATTRIETEFQDDTVLQAKLLGAIGETYEGLGLIQETLPLTRKSYDQLREHLGPDHEDTLHAMFHFADCCRQIGDLEQALAVTEQLVALCKAQLSPKHRQTLKAMYLLAIAYFENGKQQQSRELLQETLALQRKELGSKHEDTLESISSLAAMLPSVGRLDESIRLAREAFTIRQETFGPGHPYTIVSMCNLATAYLRAGEPGRALQVYEEALPLLRDKLGEEHPDTLTLMYNLAGVYRQTCKLDQAIALQLETWEINRRTRGVKHPHTLDNMASLAAIYWELGKLNQSIPLYEEALTLHTDVFGEDHPDTLFCMANLAVNYMSASRVAEALPLLEDALRRCRQTLGNEHPHTLFCMHSLAGAYTGLKRFDEAVPLMQETLCRSREQRGPKHPETLMSEHALATIHFAAGHLGQALQLFEQILGELDESAEPNRLLKLACEKNLGVVYRRMGRTDEAKRMLEKSLEEHRAQRGDRDHRTFVTMNELALAYQKSGELDEAVDLFTHTIDGFRQTVGLQHPDTLISMDNLAKLRVERGEYAEAAALIMELLPAVRQSLSPDSTELAGRLAAFGMTLLHAGAFDDAESVLRECLAIRERTAPDDWRTFNTKSMLGGALLGQAQQLQATDAAAATAKFTEAEPLLVAGHEGMQQRESTIPAPGKIRVAETLQRLVDLYTAMDKPSEAAAWQQKCDALRPAEKSESAEK